MEQLKTTGKPKQELATNISGTGTMIRAIVGLLLPVFVLLIDAHLMIWAAPVMMYLFVCAMTHFDVIKWAWLRWVKKKPEPDMNDLWDKG